MATWGGGGGTAAPQATVRRPERPDGAHHARARSRDDPQLAFRTTSTSDDLETASGASESASSVARSRYQSARDRVSFLAHTPIEDFVAKYQVVKSSWRGKYERILALAPTRFSTVDPKDFEVTNTWSFHALIGITLDASDPEGFTLLLKGPKKDEPLKLRCRFRSRLLSDLFRLQDQVLQRHSRAENQFACSKWSRKGVALGCVLEVGLDGVICTFPDGSPRSKYLYVDMEHLTALADTSDGFAFGYAGRHRLFYCDGKRAALLQRLQAAAEAIGCMIYASQRGSTAESVKAARSEYGKSVGSPFVQFDVQKLTPKYLHPVDRVLSLHEKHLLELDRDGEVVSSIEYSKIGVLVRQQRSPADFEIQFSNGETRKYVSSDRDGVLAALYDLCVTCNENPELLISCGANERGLRLLPFFAVEDASETTSFFGDSSIGTCFLQRMAAVGKLGGTQKMGDKAFIEIAAEFNANVPSNGLIYNTKQGVITDALRPIGAQLYYISKSKPLPSRSAVTLLQTLYRISSSYYGFREVMQVGHMADSLTNLLRDGDEFAVFWTTLLLRKLTVHVVPSSINLDTSSIQFCEEVELYNKRVLFGNSYLVQSLMGHLDGVDVERRSSRSEHLEASGPRRVGPLVIMGLLQTLEGCLCSRKATTGTGEFQALVEEVARRYSTLLKVLFQSRCATTVEACTLLLKATLEECDPAVATQIRDAALVEGIVLRHFFQSIFDPSFDQRCVSRYLISLWMSHHAPAKRLLSQMLPGGFLPFLSEPAVSASELEELDQLELKALEFERESTHDLHEDSRLSFLSDSMNPEDLFGSVASSTEELRFSDSDGLQSLHTRSVSAGELSLSPSIARAGLVRQSLSFSRSSLSESSRSSVSWISATVRDSQQHTQIENNHTKARMLQKLQSSTPAASRAHNGNGHASRGHSNGAPRVRKRDIALGIFSGSLLKAKTEKLMTRRPNKALKATSSQSVLLHRRQENFRMLFFMLSRDHEQVDLIWTRAAREELRRALISEIERFSKYQGSHGNGKALWNYEDFCVHYASLASELVIGGCYVRILSSLVSRSPMPIIHSGSVVEDQFVALSAEDVPVRDPKLLIASLYRRILRENIRAEFRNELELSLLCIKCLTIVSAAHASPTDATDFEEIDYLTTLMAETVHAPILEGLHQVVRALCEYGPNAKRFALSESSVETVVKLLQMAHVLSRQPKVADSDKLWVLESLDGDVVGPLSVDDLKAQQTSSSSTRDWSHFWVRRRDDRVSQHSVSRLNVMENMQLRWELGIHGNLSPLQTAHDAIAILLAVARSNALLGHPNATTSLATGAGGLFPAAHAKCVLWGHTRQIIPLLLRREAPQLSHKAAVLLELLFADEHSITRSQDERATNRSSLFFWGLYFMAFATDATHFDEIAGLLQSTHQYQSGFGGKSALAEMLPQAMIVLLSTVSAREFSEVFGGERYSPSVIWNQRMRRRLQDSCVAHLQDFVAVLEEDVTSAWKFCHMAPMGFDELLDDLWCGGVYLGRLCADDEYRVAAPLELMRELSGRWRAEVERRHAQFDAAQAALHLGLPADVDLDNVAKIREGFRQKAMMLEEEMLASGDYDERLESLKEAYWVLTCPRPSLLSDGHDPANLLLLLKTFVLMCTRYPGELSAYQFDCYDLLIALLLSHCSADGTPPPNTSEEQRMGISLLAAELLQQTCAVSASNGELLLDEPALRSLERVVNYCVGAIAEDSADDNVELVQICLYIMQTVTGLMSSPRGRSWISDSTTLIVDMVRLLWMWNHSRKRSFFLTKVTQQVLEGVSRMCLLEQNQDLLLQRGVLWQLLTLCFQYNVEIDDATARARLQSGAFSREGYASVEEEVQNLLAIMAVRAMCRLGGIFPDGSELCSPKHVRVRAVMSALLTPNLAALLELNSHHEYLKIFHANCESYTLFWNGAMRRELRAFVAPRAAFEPSLVAFEDYEDAIRFRFETLKEMFSVGGLYIETLMASFVVIKESRVAAPVPELGLTTAFFSELFAFIDNGELRRPADQEEYLHGETPLPYSGWGIEREQLQTSFRVTALECLAVISFVVPAFVVQNILVDAGLIKMVLRLLFPPDNEVHEASDAEKSIVFPEELYEPSRDHCLAILESLSCVDAFGKASVELGICDILIEIVHLCKPVGPEALGIIRNLCAHGARTEFIAEILQSGCYIEFIAWMLLIQDFVTEEELADAQHLRQPCVQILAEIGKSDATLGTKAEDALVRIFPVALVHALVQYPETFIEFFETDHENPELVWNAEFRSYLQDHVTSFLNQYYASPSLSETETSEDVAAPSIADNFVVDYFSVSPYPIAGNVHLPLFLKNPTFQLREPLFFVTCLWEEFEILVRELAHITSSLRQTMSPDDDATAQRGFELLDLATSCLVCAVQVNLWVLDDAARLKFPEYCCNFLNESVRHQSAEPCVVNVVRVLRVFTLSKACVAALRPVVSTALTCLMSAINPFRRGALHYESGYVLEIMRRIVQLHPEHGDHDSSSGIVFIASRLDLFGYFLNILENPESLGTVKEPQLVRAIAVEILNMLEKNRVQGNTAHQILKKNKKWEKKFRFEPTDSVRAISTEDPFLQKQNPHLDQLVRDFVRTNAPRARPAGSAAGPTRGTGSDRTGRASTMRSYRESPGVAGKAPVSRRPYLDGVPEKKKTSFAKKLF
ncbi:hypothetical protein PybrP1_000115 [[Pythium] brassicae (nom. inval.)]|nr:hypothetical protein PybrP1_000115 [[Pythium] brassicae (nom. inval.)]